MRVVIYTRPGCHLCEEALALARDLAPRHGARISEVNIEQDDDLHRRYLEAIPVIEIDGVERLRIDGHRYGGLEREITKAAGRCDDSAGASY